MNRNTIGSVVIGLMFIACGFFWFLGNLFPQFGQFVNWGLWWPIFLFAPGLFFWMQYLVSGKKKDDWGLLIPANILVFLSFTFFTNIFVSEFLNYGEIWAWTVFMYPGSVAIAFWITWIASRRNLGMLIPAIILTVISLFLLCIMTFALTLADTDIVGVIWPVVFVIIGIMIIVVPLVSYQVRFDWDQWGKNFEKQMEEMGESIERSVNSAFKGSDGKQDASQERPEKVDVKVKSGSGIGSSSDDGQA